jgi:hypothetical protein
MERWSVTWNGNLLFFEWNVQNGVVGKGHPCPLAHRVGKKRIRALEYSERKFKIKSINF